jgi:hypothetical protein
MCVVVSLMDLMRSFSSIDSLRGNMRGKRRKLPRQESGRAMVKMRRMKMKMMETKTRSKDSVMLSLLLRLTKATFRMMMDRTAMQKKPKSGR